jgi:hypothetical protein
MFFSDQTLDVLTYTTQLLLTDDGSILAEFLECSVFLTDKLMNFAVNPLGGIYVFNGFNRDEFIHSRQE